MLRQNNWYNKYNKIPASKIMYANICNEGEMLNLPTRCEPKKTQTPTWTTLLLDYAMKVMHLREWA